MTPEENKRAELTIIRICELNIDNEPDRVLFRERMGITEGEYQHLKHKYSRVLERYRKENDDSTENA